jgi:hypothetical protein
MRVALIVVSALMVATPSEASKSCMSKTEARQHFGSVHIYWHGPEHCWDATPTRRQHRIRQARQTKIDQPKWQDAMSEMLPDREAAAAPTQLAAAPTQPAPTPPVTRPVDIEQSPIASRWVDIVQVAPPPATAVSESGPVVTPRGVVMAIMFVIGALTIVMMFQRPPSRRSSRS